MTLSGAEILLDKTHATISKLTKNLARRPYYF